MANPKTKPETLEPIRNALMSDPSKMVFSHTDLTQGKGTPEERAANSKAYDDFIAPHISGDNIERNKVFHSVHQLRNKIGLVTGAPGTLKTSTIAIMVSGLVMSGKKVLFTAAASGQAKPTTGGVKS